MLVCFSFAAKALLSKSKTNSMYKNCIDFNMVGLTQKQMEIKKLRALRTGVTVNLTMLHQQLQYVGKHLLRSVQTPNEVQMVPVFDVSMKY